MDDERAREAIGKCEAHYEAIVGAAALRRFVEALAVLRRHLDLPAHPSSLPTSIGMLPLVALKARDELVRLLADRGHTGLTPAQHDVLALVGREGARPVDLARSHGVSRQAASSTLAELEQLGYVRRRSDEPGGRAVTYARTDRGHLLLDDDRCAVDTIEAGFAEALGARRMAALRSVARDLALGIKGPPTSDLEALASRLRRELGPIATERLGRGDLRTRAGPVLRPHDRAPLRRIWERPALAVEARRLLVMGVLAVPITPRVAEPAGRSVPVAERPTVRTCPIGLLRPMPNSSSASLT